MRLCVISVQQLLVSISFFRPFYVSPFLSGVHLPGVILIVTYRIVFGTSRLPSHYYVELTTFFFDS